MLPALKAAIEQHITGFGVTTFIVGGYGNFDYLASKALVAAKQEHPELHLLRLIPYHPAERPIELPEAFDGTYYPPGMEKVPRQFAIVRANRYTVNQVDYLIAYAWHPASNARDIVEYAERREQRGLIKVMHLRK